MGLCIAKSKRNVRIKTSGATCLQFSKTKPNTSWVLPNSTHHESLETQTQKNYLLPLC